MSPWVSWASLSLAFWRPCDGGAWNSFFLHLQHVTDPLPPSPFHLYADYLYVCLSSCFLIAHFHWPTNLQDSSKTFMLEGVKFVFISLSHAPGLPAIQQNSNHVRFVGRFSLWYFCLTGSSARFCSIYCTPLLPCQVLLQFPVPYLLLSWQSPPSPSNQRYLRHL